MSSYQAESVFVPVIPSLRSFAQDLAKGINSPRAKAVAADAGETLGLTLTKGARSPEAIRAAGRAGESFGKAVGDGLRRTFTSRTFGTAAAGATKGGQQAGQAFGTGFTRDVNGKLRDARGRFVSAGGESGSSFSKGFGKSIGGGGGGGILGSVKKLVAPIAALFAVDQVVGGLKTAITAGSDLNETINKTTVIFGSNTKAVRAWAGNSAQQFGLTEQQALAAAASFGNMFTQLGFTEKAALKMSQTTVQMSADIGSFNNLPTADVQERIAAAFRGEYDSLQQVIPNINAARVEQQAMSMTGKENAKQITAQEKAAAVLAIVQKDGSRAMGDFARTSGDVANQGKITTAMFGDLAAKVGVTLQPLMRQFFNFLTTTGIPALGRLVSFISNNAGPAFNRLRSFLGPVIAGVAKLFSGIQTQGPPVTRFFNGKLMPAFLAIVAAGRRLGVTLIPIIRQIAGEFMKRWPVIAPLVKDIFKTISEIVLNVMAIIKRNIDNVTTVIRFIWQRWGKQITTLVGSAFEMVVKVISGAMKIVGGIVKVITGIMTGDWRKARQGISDIVRGLRTILIAIWQNIRTQVQVILGRLIENLVGRWMGFLRYAGGRLKAGLAAIKGFITAPIAAARDALVGILTGIQERFGRAVTRIGNIWAGLKKKASDPIEFIVNTVFNDGLRKAFNTISGIVNGPSIPPLHFAGFREGGPTGRINPRKVAGVVHGNEHVVTDEEVRKAPGGHRFWESIRERVLHGRLQDLPGYFLGGGVRPVPGAARKHSGYGFARWAGDMSAGMGTPVKAWKAGIVAAVRRLSTSYGHHVRINHGGEQSLYAHLSRIAVSAGQRVRAGQKIGNVGSTGNSTGPHLHFEIRGGGAPIGTGSADKGSGSAAPLAPVQSLASWIREQVAKVTSRFSAFDGPLGRLKEIAGSKMGQLAGAAVRRLIDPMKDLLTGKAKTDARKSYAGMVTAAQAQGPADNKVKVGATGSGRAGLRRAALRLGSHSAFYHTNAQGPSMDMMVRNKSIGNAIAGHAKANARKYGVEYLVWNRRIWNIRRNAEGWRRYTGTSNPHTDHVHSTHFDSGGMLQPGLNVAFNGTGKPERVLTEQQWSAIGAQTKGGDSGGGVHDNTFYGYTPRDVIREHSKYVAEQRALHPSWT